MAKRTKQEIEAQYQADLEKAKIYRDTGEEAKAVEMELDAERRRGNSLRELSDEQDLDTAREKAKTQFPLADPSAITGTTPEEIIASAERSHNYVKGHRDTAVRETKESSRAEVGRRWGPDGRPAVPQSEVVAQRQQGERSREEINADIEKVRRAGGPDVETRVLALMRERGSLELLEGAATSGATKVAQARD